MYNRLDEITPLVNGGKSYSIYIMYHRLEEITPLIKGVKSYSIYITHCKKLHL